MIYKDEQKKTKELLKPRLIVASSQFNRAYKRRRSIDRTFTKKGYNFGRRIGSAADNILHHLAKIQGLK